MKISGDTYYSVLLEQSGFFGVDIAKVLEIIFLKRATITNLHTYKTELIQPTSELWLCQRVLYYLRS